MREMRDGPEGGCGGTNARAPPLLNGREMLMASACLCSLLGCLCSLLVLFPQLEFFSRAAFGIPIHPLEPKREVPFSEKTSLL